jgi:hypothetical protein
MYPLTPDVNSVFSLKKYTLQKGGPALSIKYNMYLNIPIKRRCCEKLQKKKKKNGKPQYGRTINVLIGLRLQLMDIITILTNKTYNIY